MPYKVSVNVGGTWKTVNKIYVNINGTWQEVDRGYVNVSGIDKLSHAPEYSITASVGSGSGSISPSGVTTKYSHESQAYTITPLNSYWIVSSLVIDGVSVSPVSPYTFSGLQGNHTIVANFARRSDYYINSSITSGSGTISPVGTSIRCNLAENKTFTITPTLGHKITQITIDGVDTNPSITEGSSSSYTFTNIMDNHTIAVTFAQIPHFHITTTSIGSGSIDPSDPTGTIEYLPSTSKVCTITPSANYYISSLVIDGIGVTPPITGATTYTFSNILQHHTIVATFSAIPQYTITSSVGTSSGTITPLGITTKYRGESQTYTITPTDHYKIVSVYVDGVNVGAVTTYTFTNLQTNHTIIVNFVDIELFTVTASVAAGSFYIVTFDWGWNWTPYNPNLFFYYGQPAGVSVYKSGVNEVERGGSVSFNITPSQDVWQPFIAGDKDGVNYPSISGAICHFEIEYLLIDGVRISPTSVYTFSNVQANHTIVAYGMMYYDDY